LIHRKHRLRRFEIATRTDFSHVTYRLETRHPQIAKAAKPGHFVIVTEHEHGEHIPLTIADFDRDRGTITLVIQAVGKTAKQMQQSCRVGTRLHGVAGPMGIPSHIGRAKKVVCVCGSGTAVRAANRRSSASSPARRRRRARCRPT
jgi:sulfide dehydrogenase subunit beta